MLKSMLVIIYYGFFCLSNRFAITLCSIVVFEFQAPITGVKINNENPSKPINVFIEKCFSTILLLLGDILFLGKYVKGIV